MADGGGGVLSLISMIFSYFSVLLIYFSLKYVIGIFTFIVFLILIYAKILYGLSYFVKV